MTDLDNILRHERDEVLRCEPHGNELFAVTIGLSLSLATVYVYGGGSVAGVFDETFDDTFE